jgi:hypothetical protein
MITLHEGSNIIDRVLTPIYVPPPVANLSGIVTNADTGGAVSGVKVTIAGLYVLTGTNGQYNFTNLTPGNYTITFEKTGYNTLTL